ncbi:vWA domain-containing protein [Thalassobacillus devorans]|uniref:vWA domain-containing protein n=1 Tax=Thalassobacillus devorans TaxID=279813 RepID=UPI0004B12BF4|nr:VWA domain-containing protein [Thalassobacillus devorans]
MVKKSRMKNAVVSSVLSVFLLGGSVLTPISTDEVSAKPNKKEEKPLKIKGNPMDIEGNWYFKSAEEKIKWELTWEAERSSKGYEIYRSPEEDGEYELIDVVEGKFTEGYIDEDVQTGEVFFYKVRYYKNNSKSPFSDPIKVDYELDSDGDTLSDYQELNLGTDKNKKDTDEDGLPDNFELQITLTDPANKDSDENGTEDGQEDLDEDGLTNAEELELETDPKEPDTDHDGWNDGKEISKGTDPLFEDTDEDKVIDGLEEEFGFDPLNPDTNDNSVLDGDETVEKSTEPGMYDGDDIVTPSVQIKSKASLANSTTITNIEGTSSFLDNAPGIGAAFDFQTEIDFDEAAMTFTYDTSKFEEDAKPAIFYYNEEAQLLEKLPDQSHDKENGTVTATVNHFSKYILLDETDWDNAWSKEIRPPAVDEDGNIKNVDVVFSIDSSGSMDWNDPDDLRKTSTKNFVDKLKEKDRAAVVDFDSDAKVVVELTTDKQSVKVGIDSINSSGGTNLYQGVMEGVEELANNGNDDHNKFLIFLTDGDGTWRDSAIDYANEHDVIIYTIGLGSGVQHDLLERIATSTGGKYFYADQADQLEEVLEDTSEETISCTADKDEDGLTDCMEVDGFRIGNGQIIYTDPEKKDTDDDGLEDSEEISPQFIPHHGGYYVMLSDPTLEDTDHDYKNDDDEAPDRRKVYDFTEHLSVFMSDLSYNNLEGYIKSNDHSVDLGKTTNATILDSVSDLDIKQEHLKGWKLIKGEDSHFFDSGFSALAFKRGNMVVFAYRGTDISHLVNDTVADIGIGIYNNNWQVPMAGRFAGNTIIDLNSIPNLNVNVTGHSLGGFLAQAITHDIIENELYQHYWNIFKIGKITDALSRDDLFNQAYTFNAAPFFKPVSLAGAFTKFFTTTIPYERIDDAKYHPYITNYSIKNDFLSITVPTLAERLGADPAPFNKTVDGNAHKLSQYYSIFR